MKRTGFGSARLLIGFMLGAMIVGMLAACGGAPAAGGGAPTSGGVASAAATEQASAEAAAPAAVASGVPEVECRSDQKQLVWMVRNNPVENEWEANVVRPAFSEAHPDICLNILSVVQDDIPVKRDSMIAAHEPLHVWSGAWGASPADIRVRGLIEDLAPFIERDNFDLSVFNPDLLSALKTGDQIWGLPFLSTGSYVYYNKKLFDEAGVAYPPTDWDDPSWTWEKFVELGKQLTKNVDDPNNAQFGAVADVINTDLEFPPMLWGHDIWPAGTVESGFADQIDSTAAPAAEAYQAFHDLIHVDKVAPDPATIEALNQLGGAFASGRLAMQITGGWGHWVWHDLIDDPQGFCWGVAPLPLGAPDAAMRAVTFTDPWVMTANMSPEDQEIAWTFIKFLLSPEQAKLYSETTGTPPTQTALLEDYYKQYSKCMDPEQMKSVFEGAFSHGRPSSDKYIVRWDELRQIWRNSLDAYWSDPNADTAQMLQDVQAQTNEALQRLKQEQGQ